MNAHRRVAVTSLVRRASRAGWGERARGTSMHADGRNTVLNKDGAASAVRISQQAGPPDMRAVTVVPGRSGSAALAEVPEPDRPSGSVLVRTLAAGICGTDREILADAYGSAPPGRERLIIGRESLGQVLDAPTDSGLRTGDLVVGIVRRPDPLPCASCGVGEWDMCRNGGYTERGIKELDGYASERFVLEAEFAVKVESSLGLAGILLEPASVVAKAWDHIDRIGRRARSYEPRTVLVTGAGPVGLLAAMMGVQRGLEVHVFDRVREGLKPQLVRELGGTYHAGTIEALGELAPDIVIECTGAASVVLDALERTAPCGIVCLAGTSSGGRELDLDVGLLNRRMVLENDVLFGSVNANRAHYELAAFALAQADANWLSRLITRRVPLARWREAYEVQEGDVKVVLEFSSQT